MEIRHIQSFLVLSQTLHFGRAARQLHLSQPGLSRQIQALERDLGVALFHRLGRRVALTPAGQVLVGHARQIADDLAEARRAVASLESDRISLSAVGRCDGQVHDEVVERPERVAPHTHARP